MDGNNEVCKINSGQSFTPITKDRNRNRLASFFCITCSTKGPQKALYSTNRKETLHSLKCTQKRKVTVIRKNSDCLHRPHHNSLKPLRPPLKEPLNTKEAKSCTNQVKVHHSLTEQVKSISHNGQSPNNK